MAAAGYASQPLAPAFIDEVDPATGKRWRFHRTEIEKAEQLTNGRAWIQVFEHVVAKLPRPRRQLGVSLSDSSDPRYTMPGVPMKQRNDAVKAMRDSQVTPGLPDAARKGPGQVIRLRNGEEVLLICNVGASSPKELPQKFREMSLEALSIMAVSNKCPHMGGCLNEGELKDVEDLAGGPRRAILRCPWHNWQFDVRTGEGIGNHAHLPTYPVRVVHGALYVATLLQEGPTTGDPNVCDASPSKDSCGAMEVEGGQMEVDMEDPEKRRSRSPRSRPRSPRVLRLQHTVC
eukprot:TRINITY_DN79300_c0_g1_i1.p1 TRINITY_DN79300_c0_g1~~TRINITY_DN79300_c0_g1_i1.p1  ORF type:complete len:289 (+),score=48.23 TRINITY_DN79300_c0_g1_i1:70-936(+)